MDKPTIKIQPIETFGSGVQAFRIIRLGQPAAEEQKEQVPCSSRTANAERLGEELWQQVRRLPDKSSSNGF